MNKRNLLIGTLMILAVASPASALTLNSKQEANIRVKTETNLGTTSTSTRAETRAEMKAKIDANLEERKAEREEFKAKIVNKIGSSTRSEGGFLGNIVEQRVRNIYRLFDATINRFEKLIDRIESRMDKIEAAGGVTTEVEASLNLAKSNLAEASAQLVLLGNIELGKGSTSKSTSTEATLNLERAKNLAIEIRNNLREVKENLLKTVRALVEVQKTVKVNANATSTATTTSNN